MLLNDKAIDLLIQPVVDRQEAINNYIIEQICDRINTIGKVLPSDVQKLVSLIHCGSDARRINKRLAYLTGLQEQDIKAIIRKVAVGCYKEAEPYYNYRKLPYVPLEQNVELNRIIKAVTKQTIGTYRNLANTYAFMIQTGNKKYVPTRMAKAYQLIMDQAIQATVNGSIDYNTAMKESLKRLVDGGIYVQDGNTPKVQYAKSNRRADSAVRQNILDGVRQVFQGMQDEIGKQVGADGVEISVHQFPAPDHAPCQGHQFTMEEFDNMQNNKPFEDIQGRSYLPFERHITQWNCKHFAYNIVIGCKTPNFTDNQLNDILKRNDKGYTFPDGKHLTMYQCTQRQRAMETKIRYLKDNVNSVQKAGNMELLRTYKDKLQKATQEYKLFCRQCGLAPDSTRLKVSNI